MNTTIKRSARVALVAALVAGAIALTGCVANPAQAEKSSNPDVWGYVASADKAQLDISEAQLDAQELVVKRVQVPDDAWVVVHIDDGGKPGMRVGLKHVDRGESTNVKVKLKDVTSPKVIVAIHADRGTDKKFDFDMMNKEMSPDRPFFVNEKELAKVVTVREFGVKANAGEAAITVSPQPGAKESIVIGQAITPTDAWVVVHLDVDGAPGARVGLLHIPAGTNENFEVKLDPVPLTDKLLVAVHPDRGQAGLFEFDMMDKLNSPDQPFFVNGEEVATAVPVK
ncbi:MAG TPA: hypothetical protein VFG89_09970 [Coriobacteriia bacterium]|nr:hypothetical protein [Coriobacteriia bacterium]